MTFQLLLVKASSDLKREQQELENAGLFQVTYPSTGVHADNIHSLCTACVLTELLLEI